MKKILSIILVSAVLFGMVLSANAYTLNGENKTAALAGDTYVFDWKDASGNAINTSELGMPSGSKAEYNVSGNITRLKLETSTGGTYFYNDGVSRNQLNRHEIYLKDPDFSIGGDAKGLKAEAGHTYEITLRYNCTKNDNESRLFLVANQNKEGDFAGASYYIPEQFITKGKMSYTASGYAYVETTYTINADEYYKITAASSDTQYEYNLAGSYIGLSAFRDRVFYVTSVTVKIIDNEVVAKEEAKTAALYSYTNSNNVALNFNGGLNDLYMPNQSYSNLKFEIAQDPAGISGNVVKVNHTATSAATKNFSFAAATGRGTFADYGVAAPNGKTAEGFQIVSGKKYYVSYDIYVESFGTGSSFADNHEFYVCESTGCGKDGGNKKKQTVSIESGRISELTTGKWITVTYYFTAANSGNCVIAWQNLQPGVVFYMDNISVRTVTGDSVAYNIKRSIRAESGEGDAYVSAGLRLRGEIWGEHAAGSSDLGFIVVPEALANGYNGDGNWFELNAEGKANLSTAKVVSAKDKLYGTNGENNQYQVIITNLTTNKEGVEGNLKNVNFTVVMYRISKTTGEYTYYTVGTASYNEINAAYLLAK